MGHDIQVEFFTKLKHYAIPSTPLSISRSTTPKELDLLVKELMRENGQLEPKCDFIFLINGEVLLTSLQEHIETKEITEELMKIEYDEKQKAPEFYNNFEQDDLVSCIRRYQNYVLTGSYDGTVRIWKVDDKKCLLNLELDEKIKSVDWLKPDFSSSQVSFVIGSFDQTAQIWSLNLNSMEATCIAICRGHSGTVMSVASGVRHGNQYFVSGSWDGTIKLWSASLDTTDLSEETGGIAHSRKPTSKVPTRIPRMTLAGHRETITRVCWVPAGSTANDTKLSGCQILSVSWDRSLRLWDCATGSGDATGTELRCVMSNHAFNDADAALQGVLTASSDNIVRIYDLRSKEALALSGFQGHSGWLTSVAWAPHRPNLFVTGSIDRSVRLWDTRNAKASVYDLMGHADMVTGVDWAEPIMNSGTSNCKHYILSCSADATIKVYRYDL